MNTYRKTAIIVGTFFLIAMAVSLIGGIWLETIISVPDFLVTVAANETQVIIGVLLELINGIAVVGIAVMMFPIFRRHDEALALGYVALRIIEAVVIIVAAVIPLSLIALSQEFVAAGAPDASGFQALGASLLAARAIWAGQMLGIFFCIAALLLYYLLYQSKLVPLWLSGWGFIAVALVLLWNLLELFGISISFGMALALPMILNEIVLAIWLIIKGFNPSAIAAGAARTGIN